jgi:hypothetical protein
LRSWRSPSAANLSPHPLIFRETDSLPLFFLRCNIKGAHPCSRNDASCLPLSGRIRVSVGRVCESSGYLGQVHALRRFDQYSLKAGEIKHSTSFALKAAQWTSRHTKIDVDHLQHLTAAENAAWSSLVKRA